MHHRETCLIGKPHQRLVERNRRRQEGAHELVGPPFIPIHVPCPGSRPIAPPIKPLHSVIAKAQLQAPPLVHCCGHVEQSMTQFMGKGAAPSSGAQPRPVR